MQELSIKNKELEMKNGQLSMDNAAYEKRIAKLETMMVQLLNQKTVITCPPLARK